MRKNAEKIDVNFRRTGTLNLTEATMFRARAVRYACLLRHLVKHCRSDDNSLGEKIWIKPHLKPQDLPGELIILFFYI